MVNQSEREKRKEKKGRERDIEPGRAHGILVPLPRAYLFDKIKITDYITQILQQFSVQGAYSILAAVENSRGEITVSLALFFIFACLLKITPHADPSC